MSDVRIISGAPIKSGTYEQSPISPCSFFLPYFYPGGRNAHFPPFSKGAFNSAFDCPPENFYPLSKQIPIIIGNGVDVFSTPASPIFLPFLFYLSRHKSPVVPPKVPTCSRKNPPLAQTSSCSLQPWCPPMATSLRGLRKERRFACLMVLKVLLRHLDEDTLCIGRSSPELGFIALDMKSIVRETGLNQRRCERAIALLNKMGLLEVRPPQYGHNPTKYSGLRAVRAITPALIEWLQAVSLSEIPPKKSDSIMDGGAHESV